MNNTSKSFIKDVEFPVMMNLTNAKISPRDRSNASSHRYDSNIFSLRLKNAPYNEPKRKNR